MPQTGNQRIGILQPHFHLFYVGDAIKEVDKSQQSSSTCQLLVVLQVQSPFSHLPQTSAGGKIRDYFCGRPMARQHGWCEV